MKSYLSYFLIIVLAGGAGFGLQRYLQQPERELAPHIPDAIDKNVIGNTRPEFSFYDLEGKLRNINEWNGKVLLINFWATWCPPCKKEMPEFMEAREQFHEQGFEIIGVALDNKASVKKFAEKLGVNYPILIAEHAGIDLSREYGNRIGALPFSVFISRDGKIHSTKAGELSRSSVIETIVPLLK